MNRKITVNGREYGSTDEMPPEIREAYQQAMAALAGADSPTADGDYPGSATTVTVKERFIVNGQEYPSLDEVPPEARSAIEAAMAKNQVPVASAGTPAVQTDPAGSTARSLERIDITSSGDPSSTRTRLIVAAVVCLALALLLLLKVAGRL